MDSKTIRNSKVEIVSPAGNYEKLKFAVKYGADAVYFGGEEFNLRDKAGNLTLDEISEAVSLCRESKVKTVFLLNAFLHENDVERAGEYIRKIKNFDIDAIMVSDPGMLMLLKEKKVKQDIYLSTQMSTLNHLSIKFWTDAGIKRIVLARETTLDEIRKIRQHTDVEIEIFAHGAVCVSYSGRCLLSRFLSGRDANQGACSHPCRWDFALVEEKREGSHLEIIEHARGTEILSSKDLCLIEKLDEYINAGVNAFKLEGRMKSIYYTANITRIYKHAAASALNGTLALNMPDYLAELDLVSHRPYTDDLFNEFDNLGFQELPYIKKVLFVAYKLSDYNNDNMINVKTFNPVRKGEILEAIYPEIKNGFYDKVQVIEIIDPVDEKVVDMAQPKKQYIFKFDKHVADDAIFRRRLL